MAVRIGVNGIGRIGRCVIREWFESGRTDVEIVAMNFRQNPEQKALFLKYDSTHGRLNADVTFDNDSITMGNRKIRTFHGNTPAEIMWQDAGVDVVLECTGVFTKREAAAGHLKGGVKKVLVSAPSPDADSTIVYKVNNAALKPEHQVISVGSCTTNCLAPVAKVLNDGIGIESGFMTTIHAFTNDQNLLDNNHKDNRRARTAGASMIPTTTGAAKALGIVLPELKGKLDGTSIRVPVQNVSLVDLTFSAARDTSVEEINVLIRKASEGAMKGVLGYNTMPLVSVDFNHTTESSIFDATQTYVVGGGFVRVAAWYDNEWGFSTRMLDVAGLAG